MAMKEAERQLKEYRSRLHTPELVTMFHRTIWQTRGEIVGATYEVTQCPYTQKELTKIEQQGKRVGYLPVELATHQSRHLLGKMFPNMRRFRGDDNPVTNDKNPSGWFDYETGIAPYLNTTEEQLIEKVAKDGRKLLSLNQYIIAGQDNNLLIGQYLDERATYVRLDSRHEGRVVRAGFDRCGSLLVDYWYLVSDFHRWDLGGRSSGVKKA